MLGILDRNLLVRGTMGELPAERAPCAGAGFGTVLPVVRGARSRFPKAFRPVVG